MAKDIPLLVTTTPGVEGRRIVEYKGLVGGDAILGANMFRDMFAGLRDLVGGRAGSYEKVLRGAKTQALEDMIVREPGILSADTGVQVPSDAKGAVQLVGPDGKTVQAKF